MRTHRFAILVVLVAMALWSAPASGQARGPLQYTPPAPGQPPDIAFYGAFTIDIEARGGRALNLQTLNATETFTWVFSPEKDGLRIAAYASYPAPEPSRSYFLRLDGQPYPDPHGAGRGLGPCVGDCQEFVRFIALDRYTLVRQVTTKGKWTERVLYALSEDGNTLAIIGASPTNPAGAPATNTPPTANAPATAGRGGGTPAGMVFRRREPGK